MASVNSSPRLVIHPRVEQFPGSLVGLTTLKSITCSAGGVIVGRQLRKCLHGSEPDNREPSPRLPKAGSASDRSCTRPFE